MRFSLFIFRTSNTAQQASLGFIAHQPSGGGRYNNKKNVSPYYILVSIKKKCKCMHNVKYVRVFIHLRFHSYSHLKNDT